MSELESVLKETRKEARKLARGRVAVQFHWADGEVMLVLAYPTSTPGLVVHPSMYRRQGVPRRVAKSWRVAHERSGLSLGGSLTTKKKAMQLAESLLGFRDWTRSHEDLQAGYLELVDGTPVVVPPLSDDSKRFIELLRACQGDVIVL